MIERGLPTAKHVVYLFKLVMENNVGVGIALLMHYCARPLFRRCYVGEPAGNLSSLTSRLTIARCATRWRLVAIYRYLGYLAHP